jgi:hypothetical protein
MRTLSLFISLTFVLVGCAAAATPTNTPEPTIVPSDTPEPTIVPSEASEPTTLPTDTPMPVENPPAIELLAGSPESCVNAEDYAEVLDFDAIYYETTTENPVSIRMVDSEGNILFEDADSGGENKDGEESWGFYPLAYDLPDNSLITMEITVYLSADEDALLTSTAILTYNCTTGEMVESSFERMGD